MFRRATQLTLLGFLLLSGIVPASAENSREEYEKVLLAHVSKLQHNSQVKAAAERPKKKTFQIHFSVAKDGTITVLRVPGVAEDFRKMVLRAVAKLGPAPKPPAGAANHYAVTVEMGFVPF